MKFLDMQQHALAARDARLHFELTEGMLRLYSEKTSISFPDPNDDRFTIPATSLPTDSRVAEDLLCKACQNITVEIMRTKGGYFHSEDISDIIDSAEYCAICNLIQQTACAFLTARSRSQPMNTREALDAFAREMAEEKGLYISRPAPIALFLAESDETTGAGYSRVLIGTSGFQMNPARKLFGVTIGMMILHEDSLDGPQPILPRGSEKEVLSRLAAWLHQRELEVPFFSTQADEKPLPTRILDLGDPGDSNSTETPALIRLIETSGKLGKYAALSYAWGGYTGCRTLKSNYGDRVLGTNFEDLPPVFQQAVKVTKGLGLRYLWIDVLCIIQGDAEDWSREAGRMAGTYWNSAVRLAISDCPNPTCDFFPPKEISSVRVAHLQAPKPRVGWEGVSAGKPVSDKEEFRKKFREYMEIIKRSSVILTDENLGGRSGVLRPSRGGQQGRHEPGYFSRKGNTIRKLHVGHPSSASGGNTRKANSCSEGVEELLGDMDLSINTGHEVDTPDFVRAETMEYLENMTPSIFEEHFRNVEDIQPRPSRNTYLTCPPSYPIDVDMASLNARGWVLQERLLSPRTIHFTTYHIYCEDSDDICGEDWVRQKFKWMSSIRRPESRAQIDLFPSRKFGSQDKTQRYIQRHIETGEEKSVWEMRSYYIRETAPMVEYPWLQIAEEFNQCQLSFQTDRLAAIAGLVIQKQLDDEDIYFNDRNFCGMWEKTLYLELGWVASKYGRLEYVQELRFPSWAWISHRGPIAFAKDQGSTVSESITPPRHTQAFELLDAVAPALTTTKPLTTMASLTIKTKLRKIDGVSLSPTSYGTEKMSREELRKRSPFNFDPRTNSKPIPLTHWATCHELVNIRNRVIGFASFDSNFLVADELFCAHISTLTDEATADAKAECTETGEPVNLDKYQVPVLAYALVMARCDGAENDFFRVGFAEVNYNWMIGGVETVVKIF